MCLNVVFDGRKKGPRFPKTWLKFLIGKGGYPSPLADRNQKFDGLKCRFFLASCKNRPPPRQKIKGAENCCHPFFMEKRRKIYKIPLSGKGTKIQK